MGNPKHALSEADEVAARVETLISDGRFLLHRRLPPERRLSEELGVSRQVLRGALQILEDRGLIWRHVGKGTFVGATPDAVASTPEEIARRSSLHELLEAREAFEPVMARLAAYRTTAREYEAMETYCEKASVAECWPEYEKWDDLFHRALAEASGNILLIGWMDRLQKTKQSSRWNICNARRFNPPAVEQYSKEHRVILGHIRRKDSQRSEEAMRRHIKTICTNIGPLLSAAPDH
ncbi:FadR/GntR family transcriptional regulator [Enterovirga aerilata]|uniref:FadR family transcriptional regulator n=1 Tax=Enterovirga aerilata TaxID=2730920 RepID=A0A849IC83_9HYPH|nr:FCD domain-containing protein [Enterovirga sp. DB1703]NNM74029.1 FadR family transcriptional regulator [Enterovirga sp. DB1703]